MHKVYAIAEFRHLCYEPRSPREVYAGEHEECSGCEYHTVDRAESPYLQYFLGFDSFTYDVPFSSRSMERFRTRISPARVREAVALLRGFETNKGSKK